MEISQDLGIQSLPHSSRERYYLKNPWANLLVLAVYLAVFFQGDHIVQALLLDTDTIFDATDPWTVSNYSLIAAFITYLVSGYWLTKKSKSIKEWKIFCMQFGSAVLAYFLIVCLVGPWFLGTKILRAGTQYRVAFVDATGYQIRGDSVYMFPVHSKKRGGQIWSLLQSFDMPGDKDYRYVTLHVTNRLAEWYSDFQLRIYLDTVVVSLLPERNDIDPQSLPAYIHQLATRHTDDSLLQQHYAKAILIEDRAYVDVPHNTALFYDLRAPKEIDGQTVKRTGEYVEFEMEIMRRPSQPIPESTTELQVINLPYHKMKRNE